MGLITRQELAPSLIQELDDVYNYIQGSLNEEMGAHMANTSNPHNVTKAQVGLGNVINVLQASKSDFDSHTGNRNNPHAVTTAQIGAVPTSRSVSTGLGLTGGGTLGSNRTLYLDLNFTDGRYLTKGEIASDAQRLAGRDASAYHLSGSRIIDMGGGYRLFYGDGSTGKEQLYFRTGVYPDKRVYHSGNITYGTSANPTGGHDGDIYIQY